MNAKSAKYRDICCSCFNHTDSKLSVNSCLDNGETVSSAFFVMTGIDVLKGDSAEFTDKMCVNCVAILRNAFDFREKCLETQRKFSKLREKEDGQEDSLHKCSVCRESFSREVTLRKHTRDCHETKVQLSCDICCKEFTRKPKLLAHMLQHRQERSFTCEECKKVFTTRSGWRKHRNLVHLAKKAPGKRVHENNHLCSVCGKSFNTRQRLQNHTMTHTGEKNFPCDVCSKTFALASRLKSHSRVHTGERPYKCSECDMSFSQRNVLVCHKRLHTGEKPFECNVCGKCFRQYATLKTHQTIHTGKPIECPDCKKTFCRVSFLTVHRRKHTGEKPYACDRCPNRYRQKCHLDQHMDTHDGVKYQCDVCSKEYSKRWSLKVHMYSHTDGNRFQCSECGSSFVRKDKFRKHMKTSHGRDLNSPKQYILVQEASGESSQVTYQLLAPEKEPKSLQETPGQ